MGAIRTCTGMPPGPSPPPFSPGTVCPAPLKLRRARSSRRVCCARRDHDVRTARTAAPMREVARVRATATQTGLKK